MQLLIIITVLPREDNQHLTRRMADISDCSCGVLNFFSKVREYNTFALVSPTTVIEIMQLVIALLQEYKKLTLISGSLSEESS